MSNVQAITKLTPRITLLGAPGVGKGTFGAILSKRSSIPHISTGDIIRAEIQQKTKHGKQFQQHIQKGTLVPDELVIGMVRNRLLEKDCKNGYLLDGFPRTTIQAEALSQLPNSVDLAVNFELDKDVMIQKILGRRMCNKCGGNWNVHSVSNDKWNMGNLLPTKEEIQKNCSSSCALRHGPIMDDGRINDYFLGAVLDKREDDNIETLEARMTVYEAESKPLLTYYGARQSLINHVVTQGANTEAEMIIREIIKFYTK